VRRVIVSSSRLPYFPRVMTPIESIGGILGCRRDKGLEELAVEVKNTTLHKVTQIFTIENLLHLKF